MRIRFGLILKIMVRTKSYILPELRYLIKLSVNARNYYSFRGLSPVVPQLFTNMEIDAKGFCKFYYKMAWGSVFDGLTFRHVRGKVLEPSIFEDTPARPFRNLRFEDVRLDGETNPRVTDWNAVRFNYELCMAWPYPTGISSLQCSHPRQNAGDVGFVEGWEGEALLAEMVKGCPDVDEGWSVDGEKAVVELANIDSLADVTALRIGANPKGSQCTFWIRNIEILKKKD